MRKTTVIFVVALCAILVFVLGGFTLARYLNDRLGVTNENAEKILSERKKEEEVLHKKLEKIEEAEQTEEKRKNFIAGLDRKHQEGKFDVRVLSEGQEEELKKTEKFDPTSKRIGGRGDSMLFLALISMLGWAFYNYFLREELTEEEKKQRAEEKRQQQQPPPPTE